MGIWYTSPITHLENAAVCKCTLLPHRYSHYVSCNRRKAKLGLLSRPNPAALLYSSETSHQIHLAVDGCIHNGKRLCRMLCLAENEDPGRLITLLYKKYGPEGLFRLEGPFSLILADLQKNLTLLYRSFPTGFPLYYSAKNNFLSVSTNPLDIVQRHDIDDSLNMEQVSGFFSLDIHGWTESIFAEVEEVASGEMVIISSRGIQSQKRPLDQVITPPDYGGEHEIIQQYRHLLDRTVRKYITPAKKYGIMLSSGMDSSALAALASIHLKEEGGELQAYSWSLPNFKTGDETEKIKELCNALKIKLTLFNGEQFAPFSMLDRLQMLPDIPFNNLYWPMITELYRLASEDGINVLLNGHFGDALFPPRQTIFSDILRARRFELLLPEWRSMVKELGYLTAIKNIPAVRTTARRLFPWKNRCMPSAPEWLSRQARESRATAWRNRRQNDRQEAKRFSLLLSKMATNSGVGRYITARFGLERVEPYIDLALLRYTLNLPAYMAFRGGRKKYFAREAMRGLLPESIRTQVKHNVGNLSRFAHESFLQKKEEVRERLFDEPESWKVYIDSKWMEGKFRNNAEVSSQDLLVIWMSLQLAPWQRAIKPGGRLFKGI